MANGMGESRGAEPGIRSFSTGGGGAWAVRLVAARGYDDVRAAYLGDGAYAQQGSYCGEIELTTEDGIRVQNRVILGPDELVALLQWLIQYHPRESEYVNCHPNVLHLWRTRSQAIPTPPPILVGPDDSDTTS